MVYSLGSFWSALSIADSIFNNWLEVSQLSLFYFLYLMFLHNYNLCFVFCFYSASYFNYNCMVRVSTYSHKGVLHPQSPIFLRWLYSNEAVWCHKYTEKTVVIIMDHFCGIVNSWITNKNNVTWHQKASNAILQKHYWLGLCIVSWYIVVSILWLYDTYRIVHFS